MSKRILIVGGVAGGASCAARARRMSEDAEIIIFDRGPYVSFANCGLPYYVGDVITEEKKLLVANTDLFKNRFNIEVRVENEVLSIDRDACEIEVKNLQTGEIYREKYDALVLAPGAAPVRPPLEGIDLPGIFPLRTIPDSRKIRQWISDRQVKQAVVVGGGFIGLEMTENLLHRGISVTLVEMLPQVMPAFDPEMMTQVHQRLQASGVQLLLGDGVSKFEQTADDRLCVRTRSGNTHLAELVILGIGVRPEAKLAKDAGLDIGEKGGIRVNENMKTNDDRIWAVGDAVEVRDYVTGEWVLIPLAGPANRQGRIAADNIFGRDAKFRGVQGTTICGAFDLIMAATGANEKTLRQVGIEYEKVYLHPGHHVGYYPGAKPIAMKMLFSVPEGKVLGAQAVGEEGIEKRIDAIAMAIQRHSTVFDLEEAELCYAPQFGAAKDPVNMAGMIAANGLRGDAPVVHWEDIEGTDATIVDVREPGEFEAGHLEGAVNVPLSQLRERMDELPRDRPLWVYCQVGQRAYYATRALRLQGFDVYNLTGGFKTYQAVSS
ncbi:FAD-dependent oxidoreductase [Phormidium sp. CCY1219]|uniref:FAD-dependent oxidoreductase n=1 Tax=Phormidium sp. CCY1219 TaxID=2886104 RepID=UPI002D1EAC5F|nr:FAD-dependent oxidoreductase [Phormidium sp. CCY1219]MEB3828218.1 FAD-dependent oxidoreductase [Phormidium sp. CCY1219]